MPLVCLYPSYGAKQGETALDVALSEQDQLEELKLQLRLECLDVHLVRSLSACIGRGVSRVRQASMSPGFFARSGSGHSRCSAVVELLL